MSSADTLRMLKNAIRDVMASGEMITVTQLSEKTGIDESRIWHHIHSGEISTASFSDPQVKDYMHKKKVERIQMKRKMSGKHEEPAKEAPKEKKPKSGFHISSDDES
jgi:predicted DNA-binding transcriptional regulator AlpA